MPVGWPSHLNLLELLRAAARDGLIELDEPAFDVIGVNPDKDSTIVGWRTHPR